jgi:hypothetical protein
MELLKQIVRFIEEGTYFDLYHYDFFTNNEEYMDETEVMFQTRENGCVGSETVGQEDVAEAYRIVKAVNEKFDHSFELEVEEVDEWVSVTIRYSL